MGRLVGQSTYLMKVLKKVEWRAAKWVDMKGFRKAAAKVERRALRKVDCLVHKLVAQQAAL